MGAWKSHGHRPHDGSRDHTLTLDGVARGESVVVTRLRGEGAIRRRIMDMGITKGTEVFVRKFAPLGDPIELNVRGYELSLRREDAANIEVLGTGERSLGHPEHHGHHDRHGHAGHPGRHGKGRKVHYGN